MNASLSTILMYCTGPGELHHLNLFYMHHPSPLDSASFLFNPVTILLILLLYMTKIIMMEIRKDRCKTKIHVTHCTLL